MKTTRAIVFVAMSAATAGCDEKKADPCPKITAGGAEVTARVSTGSAPVASGGVLSAGTYNLTTLDLVLAPGIGTDAKVQCEAIAGTTRRETLRLEATSPTEGSVAALSMGNDGNGLRSENRSRATYVSAGTVVAMTVVGTVCDTTYVPQVDGGVSVERSLSQPETDALSRPYSSTDSSLTFYATLSYSGLPDCVLVSTYAKQ